ncbi:MULTISPECIES: dsRBD fold-containing protein [unclassified Mycobacterium]|uniref:dsRBD fold-containing protein n=1 Tax=unclassified Mycobacterium TaxID=2642494 RepID=UPI0007FB8EFD|nr:MULTISPECIES: dsRBD fold-containing protein [unclassified Mycobacterium]OBH05451.1 hypothetical protein A5696_25630 [Mycobacterium sp. E2699]OBI52477.1 hypothetical protein A5705_06945 [Mycobacterium sp. E787]
MQHSSASTSLTHPVVTVTIGEHRGRTNAKAELQWCGAHLAGVGVAYRHPADCLARAARHELATARALADLADQLTELSRGTA